MCLLSVRLRLKSSFGMMGQSIFCRLWNNSLNAQRYIRYRLKDFKVKKILMDNGYINPGEQYVQLRYIPALARRVK